MRELLDTEYELTAHEKALDDIYQKLMANENIVSARGTLAMRIVFMGAGRGSCSVREKLQGENGPIQVEDVEAEVCEERTICEVQTGHSRRRHSGFSKLPKF